MDPSPPRAEALFAAALALPAGERGAYLKRECVGDDALRRRVEGLLRAHEQAGGFMEMPPVASLPREIGPPPPAADAAGARIGRYKLLAKLGEGGCGVVYLAEQEEPVRRRVALKVIRLGMDTREVIARFEAERQALALMDHPHIAKVFDAGSTENGRPYFVMELVRGVKITSYCDQHNLATAERLRLFTQVCHAIQHAHQKGVIHRDIKPSNILVTQQDAVPVPKVIDFGIAKATQGRLTDQTLYTAFEQFIGTPAYMSPEQAEMSSQDVDTPSDIYSLGVLLYELLTAHTPFETKELLKAGLDEIRRRIREVEPPKPSTRLSTLEGDTLATTAEHRATEPPKLIHLVRGDLDWIVMRCLEKNRARRYETTDALALDINRHLNDEPVQARPPGGWYRLQKLVRRNRLTFATITGVAVALLAGLTTTSWMYSREKTARERAVTAEQVQAHLRGQAESDRARAVTAEGEQRKLRLEADAALQRAIAAEAEQNRQRQEAEHARDSEAHERALAEAARREAEQQTKLAEQQRSLAERERDRAQNAERAAQTEAARNAEAARLMQNMLRGAGPHVTLVRDPTTLHQILDVTAQGLLAEPEGAAKTELRDALSAVYYDLGDYATSIALGGKWAGKDHPPLVPALDQLGLSLMRHGRLADAEAVLGEAVAVDRLVSVADPHRSESLTLLGDLGQVLRLAGKLDQADRLDRELAARRKNAALPPAPTSTDSRK